MNLTKPVDINYVLKKILEDVEKQPKFNSPQEALAFIRKRYKALEHSILRGSSNNSRTALNSINLASDCIKLINDFWGEELSPLEELVNETNKIQKEESS